MKKFDRLPPEQRRQEIRAAALQLFGEKGFRATTMENIVDRVSLSKGGVYRLYPSTKAILADLILEGMRLRNAYYEQRIRQEQESGRPLTMAFLVEMAADSLFLCPEISAVYVEFLWEKQRSPELEGLHRRICRQTVEETTELIRRYGAEQLADPAAMEQLGDLMNTAILSLHVLKLQDAFSDAKQQLCEAICYLMKKGEN